MTNTENLHEQIVKLKEQLKAERESLNEVLVENKKLTERNTELEEGNKAHVKTVALYEGKIEDLKVNVEELKKTEKLYNVAQKQVEELEAANREKEVGLSKLQLDHDKNILKLQTEHAQELREAQNAYTQKTNDLHQTYNERIEAMTGQLDKVRGELDAVKEEKYSLQSELNSLRSELKLLRDRQEDSTDNEGKPKEGKKKN